MAVRLYPRRPRLEQIHLRLFARRHGDLLRSRLFRGLLVSAAPFGFSRCDENILRAIQNLLRQTGQPRDLDAVALVRAARDDLAQKNDLLVPFAHRDVEIADAAALLRELGQLVVVRREKRARPDLVVQKFRHAPCDRESVEGGCSAADFIQNDEAALSRVVYDVRCFVHFDHEGRLAARKIVVRTNPGKNAIDQSDLRAGRRNETTYLRQQDDQRDLPDVGRFAGHVRSGDDRQPQSFLHRARYR